MGLNVGSLNSSLSMNISPFLNSIKQAVSAAQDLGSGLSSSMGAGPQQAADTTEKKVEKLNQKLKNTSKHARSAYKDVTRIVQGILISQAFYKITNAISSATSALMTFQNDMATSAIAFKYFIGSTEGANAFIENMKDFAALTPYTTQESLQMARSLMAMGFAADSVKSVMTIMTDATAAMGVDSDVLQRITWSLGQIRSTGKLSGQEIRELGKAGIPILKILQEELGLTKKQLANIGDLAIPGETAVAAILKGLEKRYKGASKAIAQTLPGMMSTIKDDLLIVGQQVTKAPYNVITKFVTGIRDKMEELRSAVREGGLQGVLKAIVPPELVTSVEAIIGAFRSLGRTIGYLGQILQPIIQNVVASAIRTLGLLLPILVNIIEVVAQFAANAMKACPFVNMLVKAIIGLMVASVVSKVLLLLWKVVGLGSICTGVAKAVKILATTIQALYLVCTKNPVVGIITLIAAALIYLALSSETVSKWLDNVMSKLASLAGVNLDSLLGGANTDEINDQLDAFNEQLEQMNDDLTGVGAEADEAGKKVKDKFVASFDELYQIPDKLDDVSDGLSDTGLNLPDFTIPDVNLDVPDLNFDGRGGSFTDVPVAFPSEGRGNGGGGGGGVIPPPDTAPVLNALETVNDASRRLGNSVGQSLQPAYDATAIWAQNMNDELNSVGVTANNVLGIQLPDSVLQTKAAAIEADNQMRTSLKSMQTAISDWIINAGLSVRTWLTDTRTNIDAWRIQTELTIGTWATNTANTIGNWIIATGQNIGAWITNTGTNIGTWCINAEGKINLWLTNTKTNIGTWVIDTQTNISTWATNTGTSISTWIKDTGENIGSWITNTQTNISTWVTNTDQNITDWVTSTGLSVKNWAIRSASNIYDWGINTGTNIAAWVNNTSENIGTWSTNTSNIMAKWVNGTADNVAAWAGNVSQNIAAFCNNAITNIGSWASNSWGTFKNWLNGTASAVYNWASSTLDNIVNWARNAWATITGLAASAGESIGSGFNAAVGGIQSAANSVGNWVSDNKDWLIPVAVGTLVVGGILATVLTGGAAAPALAALALESGGIVDKDQLVRVGEKGHSEAIVPLENSTYMRPFSQAVADDLLSILTSRQNNVYTSQRDDRLILYVGTLIADNRSLKELERKLKIIRISELQREEG